MSTPRRSFIGRLSALLALGASPSALAASESTAEGAPDERWLNQTASKEHKLFLDNQIAAQTVYGRAHNYLATYQAAYGVAASSLGLICGFHGASMPFVLKDELWAKYKLGEMTGLKDASGAFVTAHPWRTGEGPTIAGVAARGVHLLACNNALIRLSRILATANNTTPDAMYQELLAGVAEPHVVVPAMVVAVSRAQERGIPYAAI